MFVKHTSFDLLVYAVKAVTECDAILGGYCFCFVTHSGFAQSASGHKDSFYKWRIVQDTGAPTTHDKPGSLTCPV